MKELSIEEKAKRYDEAVGKATTLYKASEPMSGCNVIIETIFPELKESEDERIRKRIIATIHLYYGEPLEDEAKEMIAWLEKQGEQKPAEEYNITGIHSKHAEGKLGEMIKNLKPVNEALEKETPESWNEFLDEQDEQKPTDKVEPKFKVGDEIKTANEESLTITKIDEKGYWSGDLFICDFDDAAKWELVEQKPAWSEEDKRIIDNLISQLGNLFSRKLIKEETKDKYVNWLKSLKYRYTWRPSDEQFNNTSCTHLSKEEAESKVWKQ